MKRRLLCPLLFLCALLLCACVAQTHAPQAPAETALPDHTHALAEIDNVLPHEVDGYCGNTMTTVKAARWEASFYGNDSVALTDLLRWLDYSEDVCRCASEYTVTTEFADTPYAINLTEGFARHDDRQAALTAEQVDEIAAILDRAEHDKTI